MTNRTIGLACLRDIAVAFVHARGATLDGAALAATLARLLEPALAVVCRPPAAGAAPEHLAVLRSTCTACMPLAPTFVVRRLLCELIASSAQETALTGVEATLDVLKQSTARLLQTAAPGVRPAAGLAPLPA